jgi:hypothetical protein
MINNCMFLAIHEENIRIIIIWGGCEFQKFTLCFHIYMNLFFLKQLIEKYEIQSLSIYLKYVWNQKQNLD